MKQLEELSPAVASLAVSVITITALLSVIARGASAEPLAWRYGAAAGLGGNGDHGLPWPRCRRVGSSAGHRRRAGMHRLACQGQ